MNLFRFRGGIHPPARKEAAASAIEPLPMPARLYVPMQQHIGSPAEPVVKIGEHVLKGQLLAKATGVISAPIHSPTSGWIRDVDDFTAPHPSGLPTLCIELEPDGKDEWHDFPVPKDPFEIPPELLAERVAAAGIVGMGGATFPTAVKLGAANNKHIHTLVINGGECEPYLTCDDRLMRERAPEVIDGIRLMLHGIRWGRALVAIENNKPEAIAAMREAARGHGQIEVVPVPALYPMGSEKQLIKTLTGREVPAGGLAAQIGVLVHNVATAFAVHEAIRLGRPLVRRIVTVSGGAVRDRRNLEVPIGTLVQDLLDHCGLSDAPSRLIMGGPMMGTVLPHGKVPIVKGSNGVLALTEPELGSGEQMPCIRCGSCVRVCPVGLMPVEMMKRAKHGDLDGALDYGLSDCLSCGTCAYVCPANLPLTQYFNYAKGEVSARSQAQRKSDYTKQLVQARQDRLEREAAAKAEAAAKRKAEREAKKAREAAQKAAEEANA